MSYNAFQKNIKTLIGSFESAREWADLNNCLQKLKKCLEKNNRAEQHDIKDKANLAKKLAQCLSPDFNVIHKTTLEIYRMIFEAELEKRKDDSCEDMKDEDGEISGNKIFGEGLGVFLSGLFGFYQYSAFEVKEKFLDIIDEQILRLTKELHVCLGGFMVCMLPALDDQSEAISKRVEDILNKTESIVGTKMFFGTVWMTLLRSSRTRIGGLKFIEKWLPKDLNQSKKKKIWPVKMIMKLVNKRLIIKAAKDSDILDEEIERIGRLEALDYYYFYYPQKEKLVLNSLIACMLDSSVYVNRMALDYLNTHLNIHSGILKTEENSVLVEAGLNLITRKDFACLKKFSNWLLSHLEEYEVMPNLDDDLAIKAIVPALKEFKHEGSSIDPNLTGIHLTKNSYNEKLFDEKKAILPITMIQTLLYENFNIAGTIMDKVAVELIDYIQDYMIGDLGTHFNRDQMRKFEDSWNNFFEDIGMQLSSVLKALGRDLSKNMENKNVGDAIKSLQRIGFALDVLPINKVENIGELLKPMLSRILAGIQKLSKNMSEPGNTTLALKLCNNILGLLKNELDQVEDQEEDSNLAEQIDKFNSFFSDLCSSIIFDFEDSALDQNDELNRKPVNPSSTLLTTLKEACNILFQVQKYADASSMAPFPKWLNKLLKCCKSTYISVSILSTETFLKFILLRQVAKDSAYYQIKSSILCGEKDKASQEYTVYLDSLQDKHHVNHNEHCHEITIRLWSFLEEDMYNEEIVNLLQKFDEYLPIILSDVVSQDLSSRTVDLKIKAISKFSTYWNLTAEKYPKYVAFPDGSSLFKMLEFLEDEIPGIRLASKSWLSISTSHFRRILDPILSVLLNPQTDVFTTLQDEMFFTDVYDSRQIVGAFSKLRSIVLNSQNEIIQYSFDNKVTEKIMEQFKDVFKYVELEDESYYLVFIQVCVKFIIGQLNNAQASRFATETHSVNATAWEFLELLLKSSKDSPIASKVSHEIVTRILKALGTAIEKHDNAMQVQLLNLLKVILFECDFRDDHEHCIEILSSETFSDILVFGMRNQVSYVRQHFLEFIIQIVPMMTDELSEAECVIPIKKLVISMIELLRKVDLSMYGDYNADVPSKKAAANAHEPKIRATILIRKQDHRALDVQDNESLVINSEMDIQHIVDAIRCIIYHCLEIEYEPKNLLIQEEYDYAETGGFSFKNLFGGGDNKEKLIEKNMHIDPLKEAVLECLRPFFISSIYWWTDLSIFLPKDYLFSRTGVWAYNEEDEGLTNIMIEDRLPNPDDLVDDNKVEGKIKKSKTKRKKKKVEEEESKEIKTVYGTLDQYIKTESNQTHNLLISVLKPIAFNYPNQLINEVLWIWLKKEDIINSNVNASLLKLMQILNCLELPLHVIMGALNYNIEKFGFEAKKVSQRKKVILELQECQRESLIFFFLYTYILHNLQYYFRSEDIIRTYYLLFRFMKYFQYSRHPTTICWMMEVLYIMSSKFSPKQAYQVEKKLKKDYQDVMQMLTENVARIISNDLNIGFSQEYCLTFVYPPSMYQHLKAWTLLYEQIDPSVKNFTMNSFMGPHLHTTKDSSRVLENVYKISKETMLMNDLLIEDQRLISTSTDDSIIDFIKDLMKTQNFNRDLRLPPNFLETFFWYYTVQNLKYLFFPLLHNILTSSSQEKIVYNLDTIVGVIIHILQKKKNYPLVHIDAVTELFACLMEKAHHILVKTYRKQISEIFFSDYFFDSSSRALNRWSTIINLYMNYEKNDLIDDIISKWNTSAGMFTSKLFETKQKCIAIKRVAFLLYSSELDKYIDKIDLLLKKMTENFKQSHLDYKVRIQLLLLCRIILLRLSHENLVESLRKLWPNLLNELIEIFENHDLENEDGRALMMEALKLIEVLSLLNIEDFQLNQWIFRLDHYNLTKKPFSPEEVKTYEGEEPQFFTPYVIGILDEESTFDCNDNTEEIRMYKDSGYDIPADEFEDRHFHESFNRHTILQMSHVGGENGYKDSFAIKNKVDNMQTAAGLMTVERIELDKKGVEQIIEKDFIDENEIES